MLFAGSVEPLPTEVAQVNFGDWKSRSADAMVIGSVVRLATMDATRRVSGCSTCPSKPR